MANISEINVAALDFDTIKQSLIDYFKADPTFQDYNFEGAALNIITDILAYNTHMNAVMANMSANEMFIDSAQLRQSIVSIAKSLAYTPRSIRTAQAVVDIAFTSVAGAPAYLTIPAGTRFSTSEGYVFSTKEENLVYPDPAGSVTDYLIEDLDIFEGVWHTFNYTVDYSDTDQKFEIPSSSADLSSLKVSVIEGMTVLPHSLNENITLLTPSSRTFFLHENPNGFFEITFGDGILGRKPIDGAKISISYIVSSAGEDANGISTFSQYQLINGYSSYTITTSIAAYGAAEKESQEEIAFRAPKLYKAQNRAVVVQDYENFMLQEYPFIESMSVWGGEYNDPPTYGRVFMAVKPSHTEFLSDNLKTKIADELINKFNVVTVRPILVDPDYIYVLLSADIIYDGTSTVLSENEISAVVKTALQEYFQDTTEVFNKPFYFSAMLRAAQNADDSIVSVLTDIQIMKKIFPATGTTERREIQFNNEITPGTVYTSFYNLSGTVGLTAKQNIQDNSNGVLYAVNALTGETIDNNVGTIDYTTGTLDFIFTPFSLPPDTLDLRIYATPVSKNVKIGFDQIILLDNSPEQQDFMREKGITLNVTKQNIEYK